MFSFKNKSNELRSGSISLNEKRPVARQTFIFLFTSTLCTANSAHDFISS
jgi:hypothetical protein